MQVKAFYKIKRVNGILWAKMYTDCKHPWYAACVPIKNAKEARTAFKDFVEELRA